MYGRLLQYGLTEAFAGPYSQSNEKQQSLQHGPRQILKAESHLQLVLRCQGPQHLCFVVLHRIALSAAVPLQKAVMFTATTTHTFNAMRT